MVLLLGNTAHVSKKNHARMSKQFVILIASELLGEPPAPNCVFEFDVFFYQFSGDGGFIDKIGTHQL